MMDFDSRFVELMHTYHIDRHHPWFFEKVRAEELLKDFWKVWCRENKGKTGTLLYEKRGDYENFRMSIPDGNFNIMELKERLLKSIPERLLKKIIIWYRPSPIGRWCAIWLRRRSLLCAWFI